MRMALCISGSPRYVDECFNFTKTNIIDGNEIDVFVHAWTNIVYENDRRPVECMEQILFKYYPKAYAFETPRAFEGRGNSQSMWYSVKACNDIKTAYEISHNFRYDIVIRHRFDQVIMSKIEFREPLPNTVYLPFTKDQCNDQFAYGSSDSMNVYSNVSYYATTERINAIYPEQVLFEYLRQSQITKIEHKLDGFLARPPEFNLYTYPNAKEIINSARNRR